MLIIRQSQVTAFENARKEAFGRRMMQHLRAVYPAYIPEEDAELSALIRNGISRAEDYGVQIEADVSRFLEYWVYFGPEFDKDIRWDWVQTILADPELDGSDKMDGIDTEVLIRLSPWGEGL